MRIRAAPGQVRMKQRELNQLRKRWWAERSGESGKSAAPRSAAASKFAAAVGAVKDGAAEGDGGAVPPRASLCVVPA